MAWDRKKERKAAKKLGIASGIFGIVFILIWCIVAVSIGAGFMLIFGIPFLGMQIYRVYCTIQFTKEEEAPPKQERDPRERPANTPVPPAPADGKGYCPYCGFPLEQNFDYCPKCGRKQN